MGIREGLTFVCTLGVLNVQAGLRLSPLEPVFYRASQDEVAVLGLLAIRLISGLPALVLSLREVYNKNLFWSKNKFSDVYSNSP